MDQTQPPDPRRTPALTDSTVMVSVVIPTYNAAPYVATTLNSVLAQTFPDYEVIVVNDGSEDTPELEQVLQPYLSKIRYFKQENRGPAAARNTAIREARGKYVAFLDSDDLWLPQHLARQVEALEKDPAIGLVYANGISIRGNLPVSVSFDNTPQTGLPTFEALLREQCTVDTSSAVASRQAVFRAGLFDEALNRCEDFDLWLRMAHNGVRMGYRREIQYCRRLGNGLSANRVLMKRGRIQAYEKISRVQPLTEEQNLIIGRKIAEIENEIQLELAKQAFLAGQYKAAQSAMDSVSSMVHSRKHQLARIALRHCPGLLRLLYRPYLQYLEALRRRRGMRSLKNVGFPLRPVALGRLAEQVICVHGQIPSP